MWCSGAYGAYGTYGPTPASVRFQAIAISNITASAMPNSPKRIPTHSKGNTVR